MTPLSLPQFCKLSLDHLPLNRFLHSFLKERVHATTTTTTSATTNNTGQINLHNRTALHVAACQGCTEIVSFLLERGAEVDPKDRWGSTLCLIGMTKRFHDEVYWEN